LTYEESNRLYQEVLKDYEGETKYKQFQKVKANEYFNGLQVKFSYAITCHKSQGTVEYCFYRTTVFAKRHR
jgi:hypothetical protein